MMNLKTISIGILTMVAVIIFSEVRIEKLAIAAESYESCFEKEYGMTPTEFYAQHQIYPDCNAQ